jgi:ADP-ribose pyrophosphatase YjhB (NUDIX family)
MEGSPVNETPRHSVSVAAAIFDDSGENVLLIKRRDNGNWEPPGGVLELDETIEDGLRREVREETGAEIEVGHLSGVYKNMTAGIVALVFTARALSTAQPESPEAFDVRWVPIDDVRGMMTPVYAVRVLDAIRTGKAAPIVRAHDGVQLLDHR